MGTDYFFLFSFIPLGIMIGSDFRTRNVGAIWLLLFAILLVVAVCASLGGAAFAGRLKTNLLFLLFLYLALGFYVCVIRRRAFASFFRAIGLGDLLFLPVLSLFFELRDFVLFLTVAFALSLLGHGLVRMFRKTEKNATIPLIATVGVCFMIYVTAVLWMS